MADSKTESRKALSIYGKKEIKKLHNPMDLQDVVFLNIQKASELDIDFFVFKSVKELWINSKGPYQIPDSFLKLEQLDKLILNENCILPENIHLLENLQELWMKGKGILNPPSNIVNLKSLKKLNISYYDDNIEPCPIPEWIFGMTQVEKIRFSVCRFSVISEKINQLKNLIDLDFGCSFSDLETFPDLSGLTNLKRLIASGKSVQGQKLPPYSLFPQVLEGAKNLVGLEHLDLSDWRPKKKSEWLFAGNNKNSIPDIFDRYPALIELILSGMKLDFVPSTILNLKNLTHLQLNQNKLDNDEITRGIQHLPYCIIDSDVVHYRPKRK